MSEDTEEYSPKHSKKSNPIRTVLEFIIVVAAAFALAFVITHYVAQPYVIPSQSMEDTLIGGEEGQSNDRILSEKISYISGAPKQGDIVTFIDVEDPDRTLIKRVIAVGGQTIDLRDGYVYVDGEKLDEPYTNGKPSENPGTGITYPDTVPDGYIWVMGDNRTNSQDSRWFGAVPVENVTGHAFFRYWPLNRLGTLD